jgi:hypothetical protein
MTAWPLLLAVLAIWAGVSLVAAGVWSLLRAALDPSP